MTGVYLLMLNGKVIYVGSTQNWPNRLVQHKEIAFDECRIIECPLESLHKNEGRLIRLLKPIHNRQYLLKRMRPPVMQWVKDNESVVRVAFESGGEAAIGERVKKELKYSPKTASTDIAWSILRNYCKLNNVDFNWTKKKFTKLKKITT